MFAEFTNVVYTGSSGAVGIADNTDFVISGTAKKISFDSGEYVTVSFDEVVVSDYEEISLYIYTSPLLSDADLFSITINGTVYNFEAQNDRGQYQQLVFDCSTWNDLSSFVITSLIDGLVLFINYFGYRKVELADMNYDVLSAIQSRIELDYDVATTLSVPLSENDEEISLTDNTDIFDNTMLKITEGSTTEYLQLVSREGLLKTVAQNAFTDAAVVEAICKVEIETYSDMEIDPICGIVAIDWKAGKEDFWEAQVNAMKLKRYLGKSIIGIYIECSSKKKVLQLASEFEKTYGDGFWFLLDGDRVEMYMSEDGFVNDDVGGKTRMMYQYTFQPSAVTIESRIAITNFTIDLESTT